MNTVRLVDVFLAFFSVEASAQSQADHPASVNKRGDQMIGFDQQLIISALRIAAVQSRLPQTADDAVSRDLSGSISTTLRKCSRAETSTLLCSIHYQVPPDVPILKELKSVITYRFENLDKGGRLIIATRNPEALAAVHEFLRFQILDHKTGDPMEPESNRKVAKHSKIN